LKTRRKGGGVEERRKEGGDTGAWPAVNLNDSHYLSGNLLSVARTVTKFLLKQHKKKKGGKKEEKEA